MKTFICAALAAVLLSGTAYAGSTTTTKHHAKIKRHHHLSADGYYRPGIPTRDPGRYSNLPGKDALYSKAYIQDH
ncbi:MAG: hypothetical protein WC670_10705 [Pseudolabrys sp.]|jgi:hypothetical protein